MKEMERERERGGAKTDGCGWNMNEWKIYTEEMLERERETERGGDRETERERKHKDR